MKIEYVRYRARKVKMETKIKKYVVLSYLVFWIMVLGNPVSSICDDNCYAMSGKKDDGKQRI